MRPLGLAVGGALLLGGLAGGYWCGARSWRCGYVQGWDAGHAAGYVKGVREAGVLDRLVALDELQNNTEARVQAGMRRWQEAAAEWNREGRQ